MIVHVLAERIRFDRSSPLCGIHNHFAHHLHPCSCVLYGFRLYQKLDAADVEWRKLAKAVTGSGWGDLQRPQTRSQHRHAPSLRTRAFARIVTRDNHTAYDMRAPPWRMRGLHAILSRTAKIVLMMLCMTLGEFILSSPEGCTRDGFSNPMPVEPNHKGSEDIIHWLHSISSELTSTQRAPSP